MKLATYDDGSRDGQLVVVSRDLATAHYATHVATRLQQVLDDWNFLAPQLEELSVALNHGRLRHAFPFEPERCMAPLPRPHRWMDHDATGAHCRAGDLVRAWHFAVPPAGRGEIESAIGVAAITGDVGPGIGAAEAIEAVRLLMLVQAWAVVPVADGAAGGEAAVDEAAASLPRHLCVRCAPVVVTPDELAGGWRSGVAQVVLSVAPTGRRAAGKPAPAPLRWPATRHYGTLIARAADGMPLGAGSVLAWYRPPADIPALGVAAPGMADAARTLQGCDAEGHNLFGSIGLAGTSGIAVVPQAPIVGQTQEGRQGVDAPDA